MTMTAMPQTIEERAEVARDLQIAARQALGASDERREWEVVDASPRRKLWVLYSMSDGERIEVPEFIGKTAINRRDPKTGKPMFTAFADQAPKAVKGAVKCFKHPDSPEAEVLREIGIIPDCNAANLKNNFSRRIHAQNRHGQSWSMYQEYVGEQREQQYQERQERQLEATLAIAGRAGATVTPITGAPHVYQDGQVTSLACSTCGQVCASLAGLKAHERSHIKEDTDAHS